MTDSFFTPSHALGYSMPPLTGLQKKIAQEKALLNELPTQDTRSLHVQKRTTIPG